MRASRNEKKKKIELEGSCQGGNSQGEEQWELLSLFKKVRIYILFFKIIIISNIEFSFLIGIDNMTVIIL